MKLILRLILLICLPILTIAHSYAECNYGGVGHYAPMYVDIGEINVPRGLPIGTLIKTVYSDPQVPSVIYCSTNFRTEYRVNGGVFATPAPWGSNVWQTNIPGIGLYYQFNPIVYPSANGVNFPGGIQIRVYKVSDPVGGGSLTPGKLFEINAISLSPTFFKGTEVDLRGGSVNPTGCTITTENLSFPIGDVNQSEFSNTVGFSPAAESTQNLGLECDAGYNVKVTLNGVQNPDVSGNNSVLALTGQGSAGVARGVGVQLSYNSQLLKLNEPLALGVSPDGLVTYPLKAKYYQTQTTVTPGSANALATLQITYQ